jgi:hypothetical protein
LKNLPYLMTTSLLMLAIVSMACTENGTGSGSEDGNTPGLTEQPSPEVTEQPAPTTPNPTESPAVTATLIPTPGVTHTPTQQAADQGNPDWLARMIQDLESGPPADPPRSIFRYEYQGENVYYLTAACCDLPSDLYDADGNLLGHPDGGFTGSGDGEFPDFAEDRRQELQIWDDNRESITEGNKNVLAPIEGLQLNIAESMPLQYSIHAVQGLPSGCASPGGYTLARDGNRVLVSLYNQVPSDPDIVCTLIYRTEDLDIPLGSDFDAATAYLVEINGNQLRFQGDQVLGASSE